MTSLQRCNICEQDQLVVLYDFNPIFLVRCNNCGLIFASPIPTEGKVKQLYVEKYFTDEPYNPFFKDCKAGYSSNTPVINDYNNILCTIEKELGGKGRLLDVGCATGVFLDVARKRGWETQGIEISEYASTYARKEFGLNVVTGELRDVNFPSGYFDAVTVHSVLEHLPNPTDFIKEVNRILRTGGILRVYTPNSGNLFYYLADIIFKMSFHLIKKPLVIVYVIHSTPYTIEHIYHFSPNNLKMLLNKVGFEVKIMHLLELRVRRHFHNKVAQIILGSLSFLQSHLGMGAMIVTLAKKTN